MRELKFRVWNNLIKKMFLPLEIYEMTDCRDEKHFGCYYDKRINIFLQFTGLKDVTGKDIYEGDIVELAPKKYICVVEYSVRDTRFILKNKNGYQGEFALIASAIKVIGNIYENPELLQ